MLTQIFIENNEVDVSASISALLTFAIDDIKDFGSRNTTFSKTIVLPGTSRNNKVFCNIFNLLSSTPFDPAQPNVLANFNAAKSAKAIIFQGNIQVFKGVVRLLEIIIDRGVIEYEVAVFGELGGFVSLMGNKKLEDLDFAVYDQNYTLANIVGSWDNTPGSGVYYPLIDYGTWSTNKHDWDYHTFRPALYAKEYIDKIFQGSNFTYDCALFNTARFKSLIVPHNQKELTRLTNQALVTGGSSSITSSGSSGIFTANIPFNSPTTLGSFVVSDSNRTYTYTSGTNITTDLHLILSYNLSVNYSNAAKINILLNGSSISESAVQQGSHVINVPLTGVTFSNGNTLQVQFSCLHLASFPTTLTVTSSSINVTSNVPVPVIANIGDPIKINSCIPLGVLQKDFFSSILKLFNLYVIEDKFVSNKLIITPYVDFYDTNPSNAHDWTYKLNRDRPIKVKPLSELTSRYYEFKFKSDSDFFNEDYRKKYNQGYGDRVYDSEYEFTQDSKSLELIFSGTPIVGYSGQDKVYSTIFKRSGTVEETINSNIRIIQSKKVTGLASWDIKNGGTVLGSYTSYGYAGHLDDPDAPANDLNFGVPKELYFTLVSGNLAANQFNVYYSPYLAEITDKDSKLMIASFRLTTQDISNLDFSKFKYIDGNYFRLNKIEDYNASNEDECTIELLKVINTLY